MLLPVSSRKYTGRFLTTSLCKVPLTLWIAPCCSTNTVSFPLASGSNLKKLPTAGSAKVLSWSSWLKALQWRYSWLLFSPPIFPSPSSDSTSAVPYNALPDTVWLEPRMLASVFSFLERVVKFSLPYFKPPYVIVMPFIVSVSPISRVSWLFRYVVLVSSRKYVRDTTSDFIASLLLFVYSAYALMVEVLVKFIVRGKSFDLSTSVQVLLVTMPVP